MNNSPAFPIHWENHHQGMTLRDYFATGTLPYLMSAYEDIDAIARVAYKMADAMLKAREA
jgi:hypothetical protein